MTVLTGLDRITFDTEIMEGQACIRGIRMPVSVIVNPLLTMVYLPQKLLQTIPTLNPKIFKPASSLLHLDTIYFWFNAFTLQDLL